MNELFGAIAPFNEFRLKVSNLHEIHIEEAGNPNGRPIVFLHGGPGGGISPDYRRFFDPKIWRVILFDQRGCGKSTPFAELRENTTWDLVSDIEKIRQHLKIDRWAVFGGSWGSTLALAYAVTHPDKVQSLILRGIFLIRQWEIDWFYQQGCSAIYPDAWEKYLAPIPFEERTNLVKAYHKRLTSPDRTIRLEAAKAWSVWEAATSKLIQDPTQIEKFEEDNLAEAFARIECHYFINRGFFPTNDFLLDNTDKIKHIPCAIVQGRYDVVCPATSAWELHKRLPQSELYIVQDSGHSAMEPGIRSKLIECTNQFARLP